MSPSQIQAWEHSCQHPSSQPIGKPILVSANIPFHKNSVGGQKNIKRDNSTNSTVTGQGLVERND